MTDHYYPFPAPSLFLGPYSNEEEPLAKYLDPRTRSLFPSNLLLVLRQRYTPRTFENCSERQSRLIVDAVFRELDKGGALSVAINNIEYHIQNIAPRADANMIARTEVDKLVNMGRKIRWEQDDPMGISHLYRLVGPKDMKTCAAHLLLHQLIGEGLPLPQFKIVMEYIRRTYFPTMTYDPEDPFFLHPNERHRPARRRIKT
jgi:hypothetical protein